MNELTTGVAIAAVFAVGLSIAFAKGVFTDSVTRADSQVRSPGGRPASRLRTTPPESRQAGLAAMEKAAADEKYLFAFFWEDEEMPPRR